MSDKHHPLCTCSKCYWRTDLLFVLFTAAGIFFVYMLTQNAMWHGILDGLKK